MTLAVEVKYGQLCPTCGIRDDQLQASHWGLTVAIERLIRDPACYSDSMQDARIAFSKAKELIMAGVDRKQPLADVDDIIDATVTPNALRNLAPYAPPDLRNTLLAAADKIARLERQRALLSQS